MFPGWLALGWAGIASAANRGRVDGRIGLSWVLRFERGFRCRAGLARQGDETFESLLHVHVRVRALWSGCLFDCATKQFALLLSE